MDKVTTRVALVSGLEYDNLPFVRRFVRALPPDKYSLLLTAVCTSCKVAEEEAQKTGLDHAWLKWKCKPWLLVPSCPVLVMLFDGGNYAPLSYLASFAMRYAPQTSVSLFGPDGPIQNSVDFLVRTGATVTGEGRRYGDYGNPTCHAGRLAGRLVPAVRNSSEWRAEGRSGIHSRASREVH